MNAATPLAHATDQAPDSWWNRQQRHTLHLSVDMHTIEAETPVQTVN
ncbi:MAG: hypothetical protein ACJ795_12585 [Ktedonobacteraceae bacterium]